MENSNEALLRSLQNTSGITLKAIAKMGFTSLTEIQAKVIPHILGEKDVVAVAKRGSGRILAFLIPAIELMYKLKFKQVDGTGILIISPTCRLSLKIFGILSNLLKHHYSITYGLIDDEANNRRIEIQQLSKGVNILIATPERLLDHLQNTPQFMFSNLKCLIVHEADEIFDRGFEEDVAQIMKILPMDRQTLLFSATETKRAEALIRTGLYTKPLYVGVDETANRAMVEGLKQAYVVCPSDKRFHLLYTFLKKRGKKKVMVFFSSRKSVKYHYELLNHLDLQVERIHSKSKQAMINIFSQFNKQKSGILFCTNVAARGLDIPKVKWIVQYDPPDDPKEYINRVGQTACSKDSSGHTLLFLRPEELEFLQYLKHAEISLKEYEFSWNKLANIQLERAIKENYSLHHSAEEAFKAYVRTVKSHSLKKVFNADSLDFKSVAKSFGLQVPPSVMSM